MTILHYFRSDNFGDALNPYLVQKLTGKRTIYLPYRLMRLGIVPHYIAIGSMIQVASKSSMIWGTGVIGQGFNLTQPMKIYAVRGPLTKQELNRQNIECPEIYGDPALLLPQFYDVSQTKNHKLGMIPHYVDHHKATSFCKDEGIPIINIMDPVESVVDQIRQCEYIASSSLHGVIVAQAYGIPAIWVEFSDAVVGKGFKFRDYFSSVGQDHYEPLNYHHKMDSADEIIQHCKDKNQKIDINLNALLEACPFH